MNVADDAAFIATASALGNDPAALAALLPQTGDVPEAARRAKAYLTEAIRHAERLSVGSGHGPVHHFHAWW
ncbi:hypothetical protein G6F61_014758 [Rhizopus arrhizus]|nr:hypothetical protein G6F61_014758 [Rhizopus arrhizus]